MTEVEVNPGDPQKTDTAFSIWQIEEVCELVSHLSVASTYALFYH